MNFWEAGSAVLLDDQPLECDVLAFKLEHGRTGIIFQEAITRSAEMWVESFKGWLREKAKAGYQIKAVDEATFRKVADSHRKSLKGRVIKTVKEFNAFLPPDWDMAPISVDEAAKRHIVPIRLGKKSGGAILFVLDEVDSNPVIADSYAYLKSKLNAEDWCEKVDQIRCSQSVIDFALNARIQVTSYTHTDSDNESVKAVKQMVIDAVEQRTSDIHIWYFDSEDGTSTVKFRIDKLLHDYTPYASKTMSPMLRQLYNNMRAGRGDGLEFKPQATQEADILMHVPATGGRYIPLTLRWQSSPIDGGCYVVLRILKNDNSYLREMTFSEFGYADAQVAMLENAMTSNSGLILTVGVTNSGKSTTNFKLILEIQKSKPHWAISTVEDPIEYRIEGIAQHQVEIGSVDGKGLDEDAHRKLAFQKTLKAMLRKDPNVIGVGEIRDETTAKTVQQFVNTGHKIITTLHADSAIYAFDRLYNIGIELASLCKPGFCSAVIYQALLPCVCVNCSKNYSSLPQSKQAALKKIFSGSDLNNIRVANPGGCKYCKAGVKGLTACAEIIEPDAKLLQFIRQQDYVGAEAYWMNEMPGAGPEFSYQGKSIIDHIIWKISQGIICPIMAEEHFRSLEQLARNNDFKRLFHKTKPLKMQA